MRLKTTVWSLEEVVAEHDPRHLDRVLRALRMRDRAHERLVRVPHVRVDHVEVPLVHRHVHRLADRAARVVQPRRRVRELHEVAEVLDRPVAAPAVEVAHERRPVRRGEDRALPAEDDVVRPVPRHLRELARSGRPDERAAQPAREPHALALHVRARLQEELERVWRVVELDPDLFEDPVGVLLERREAFLREHLEGRQRPGEERHPLDVGVRPRRLPRRPSAAAPASRLAHDALLSEADSDPVRGLGVR